MVRGGSPLNGYKLLDFTARTIIIYTEKCTCMHMYMYLKIQAHIEIIFTGEIVNNYYWVWPLFDNQCTKVANLFSIIRIFLKKYQYFYLTGPREANVPITAIASFT